MKDAYKQLRLQVRDILNNHDPIDLISAGAPRDEYDPEVTTILPRLKEAHDVEDVRSILYEEFARWFGAELVPAQTWFESPAREVGRAWRASGIAE